MKKTILTLNEYILRFCSGKYAIWLEKCSTMKHEFSWQAYSDVHEWYDAENDILIIDRTPIGD